jgi:hypothetical protein
MDRNETKNRREFVVGGALFLLICAAGRFSLEAALIKKR